ncbi:MAG TPA: phage antirepressor N-terminal domain-containing protein [Roseiflexaceae bacterium]|nr:phage antirepressor N-terminal domain-containing protein [Roseiflexaceae bacterium]
MTDDTQTPQEIAQAATLQTVIFDNDTLVAAVLAGEGVAVPLLMMCQPLGLDTSNQADRLREHAVLSRGLRYVRVPVRGRLRSVLAILHDYIPLWLATITPANVREEVRDKLIRYQEEIKDVLAALYAPPTSAVQEPESIVAMRATLARVVKELQAIREQAMAQHEEAIERIDAQDVRIAAFEQVVDARLVDIARDLAQQQEVIADQKALIDEYLPLAPAQQQYIKGTLQAIGKRHERDRGADIYGKLFGELCWKYNVPRYDAIRARDYEAILTWLAEKAAEYGYPELVQTQQQRFL